MSASSGFWSLRWVSIFFFASKIYQKYTTTNFERQFYYLDKVQYGRHQKRRISLEKMKEIQVISGRGQYYGNPAFIGRHQLTLQSSITAPLAVDEQYSSPSPRMVRETSVESTYESQHTQQQSMSEAEEEEDEEVDEGGGFGGNLKRRFFEALRRRTSKDEVGETRFEGLGAGNFQTLKAVAALAAVAGGMGGGATDPEKTAANGGHSLLLFKANFSEFVNSLTQIIGRYFAIILFEIKCSNLP